MYFISDVVHALITLVIRFRPLPPRPPIFFGRDKEVEDLIGCTLNSESPARLAILGGPGIGKSALALAVLQDQRVVDEFGERRLFIPCDVASSAQGLIACIALHLDISGDRLKQQVLSTVSAAKILLVLDNFESPWEGAQRLEVEEVLGAFSSIESCVVVITMRGTERPLGTLWTSPQLKPLAPLQPAASLQVFLSLSGLTDSAGSLDSIEKLLRKLDNIPLAVQLLANAAQAEHPDALLQRWGEEGIKLLDRGTTHRRTSLDVSIQLSLESPRMKHVPHAVEMLSLLSILPDGLAEDTEAFRRLTRNIPKAMKCIATLRQTTLAYLEVSDEDKPRRTRVLCPIREYILRHHPPHPALLGVISDFYCDLADACFEIGSSKTKTIVRRVSAELGNMESVIAYCLDSAEPEWAIRSAPKMSRYLIHTGGAAPSHLLKQSIQASRRVSRSDLELDCLLSMWDALDYGPERLKIACEAVTLAEEIGDIPQQAQAIRLQSRSGNDIIDEPMLLKALELSRSAGDHRGQGHCHMALGHIAKLKPDLELAYIHLQHAYYHFQNDPREDLSVMIWVMVWIGCVLAEQELFSLAERRISIALRMAQEIDDASNVADCHGMLAQITLYTDIADALGHYRVAIQLFRHPNSMSHCAMNMAMAAKLLLSRAEYALAEELLAEALSILAGSSHVFGQMVVYERMGDFGVHRGDYTEAQLRYKQVRDLIRRHSLGELHEARLLRKLATAACHLGDMTSALSMYITALAVLRRLPARTEMARFLPQFGQYLLQVVDCETALTCFIVGLDLSRWRKFPGGVGEALIGIGDVHLKSNHLSEARTSYEQGLEVFRRRGDIARVGFYSKRYSKFRH